MKMPIITLCAALLTSALVSFPAVAQDAKNLEQLLQMIQDSKISETKEYKQRQSEFNSDKNNQARLLKKAEDTRTAEERRSDRLEQNIRDNEQKIAALRKQLDKRLGSLKELFGHLTGAA
jgi:biopolymer transport protein ExbB